MHPAPSLILFSTLSGLGFGLLAWTGALMAGPGWVLLGLALALAGLLASTSHLRRPSRARLAFSQWRTSWLSREAIVSLAALAATALGVALRFQGRPSLAVGLVSALLALATVHCTAMIYAQIRAVPRWHHWTTPAHVLAVALAGGALILGPRGAAATLLALAAILQALHWRHGRTAFARAGATMNAATGLQGSVRSFAPPHTGPNYLLREMVHVIARRRAAQLRFLALLLGFALPAFLVLLFPDHRLPAILSHVAGVLCSRWLFFAEAEHTVGLYYGAR